jgi:transposase InsO family protein
LSSNASCDQPYKKTAALGPELAKPASAPKDSRYTITPCGDFPVPPARFLQFLVVLVGPLPLSAGYRYCLTAVDRFTRWPEAFPISDITAETLSRTLLSGWISRFGCPQTITSDQERQFQSQLFHNMAKLCETHLSRTSPHHPAANGSIERLHRKLKAAIICHADSQWTEALPLVLLSIWIAYKEDPKSSVNELVYGESLRIPDELLVPTTKQVETAPSSSSSAAAWTSYAQYRQHVTQPQHLRAQELPELHASVAAPRHHSTSLQGHSPAARTRWPPVRTNRLKLSYAAGKSPCRPIVLNLPSFWRKNSAPTPPHRPNALQGSLYVYDICRLSVNIQF